MAPQSLRSFSDTGSNIDLEALDTESDVGQSLNSTSPSGRSASKSLSSSSISNSRSRSRSRSHLDSDSNIDLNAVDSNSEDDTTPSIQPLSQTATKKSTRTASFSRTARPIVTTSNTYPSNINGARTYTNNSSNFQSVRRPLTNESYNDFTRDFTNTNTNTNTNSYSNYKNADVDPEADLDDADNDSYSFDFISTYKRKPGDKLKTTWADPMKNERQYKDLQIIDEVSKLQNLNFFSKSYVENLEKLKISQLGLLIDMVKLSENSFDEFYNIWNNFDNAESSADSGKTKDDNEKASGNSSVSTNFTAISLNTDLKGSDDGATHIGDEDTTTEPIAWFNINESEGFTIMERRKQEILKDLDNINKSIDEFDSFTKSMWTKF